MSLHADSPLHQGVWACQALLLQGVQGHMSLAPLSTLPGQGLGKNNTYRFCSCLKLSMDMCFPDRDKLSAWSDNLSVTDFTSKLFSDWPLHWAGRRCCTILASVCAGLSHICTPWMKRTVRTCGLIDSQRNCFSSAKMHGQNWSLGVLTGLFSKRESYKSRGCKIMLQLCPYQCNSTSNLLDSKLSSFLFIQASWYLGFFPKNTNSILIHKDLHP